MSKRLAVLNMDGRSAPADERDRGVDIRLIDPRVGVLPRTPYDRLLCEIAAVDAAERAIADGCDAILVESFGDYGLAAIRSLTEVPVVGAGEAAIRQAARHGRFALVTVWPPSMGYLYAERLAAVHGGHDCVAVHHVFADDEVHRPGGGADLHRRALRGDDDTTGRVVEACRAAAANHDSIDALVLGCTCMSAMAAAVTAAGRLPVVDPATAGYERAVEAVLQDQSTPPTAPPAVTRNVGRIHRLVDGWLDDAAPPDEFCGVCVTA